MKHGYINHKHIYIYINIQWVCLLYNGLIFTKTRINRLNRYTARMKNGSLLGG